MNEAPFDERLKAFNTCLVPLSKYIDNIHNVVIPLYEQGDYTVSMAAEE